LIVHPPKSSLTGKFADKCKAILLFHVPGMKLLLFLSSELSFRFYVAGRTAVSLNRRNFPAVLEFVKVKSKFSHSTNKVSA